MPNGKAPLAIVIMPLPAPCDSANAMIPGAPNATLALIGNQNLAIEGNPILNGGFETGDLTAWTKGFTPGGGITFPQYAGPMPHGADSAFSVWTSLSSVRAVGMTLFAPRGFPLESLRIENQRRSRDLLN